MKLKIFGSNDYSKNLQTAWRLNRWQASSLSKIRDAKDVNAALVAETPRLAEPVRILREQGIAALARISAEKAKAIHAVTESASTCNPEMECYGSTNGHDPKS